VEPVLWAHHHLQGQLLSQQHLVLGHWVHHPLVGQHQLPDLDLECLAQLQAPFAGQGQQAPHLQHPKDFVAHLDRKAHHLAPKDHHPAPKQLELLEQMLPQVSPLAQHCQDHLQDQSHLAPRVHHLAPKVHRLNRKQLQLLEPRLHPVLLLVQLCPDRHLGPKVRHLALK